MNRDRPSPQRAAPVAVIGAPVPGGVDVERAVFEVGDAVVYAAHGVGSVDQVGLQEIGGYSLQVIQVSFPADRMTLRIPVSKAADAGLRKIGGADIAERAFSIMAGTPQLGSGPWRHRVAGFQTKLATGGLLELAEVIRDLRGKISAGSGNSSERAFFDTALERITDELALIAGERKDETSKRLALLIAA